MISLISENVFENSKLKDKLIKLTKVDAKEKKQWDNRKKQWKNKSKLEKRIINGTLVSIPVIGAATHQLIQHSK